VIGRLRARFKPLVRRVAMPLARAGVPPWLVTVSAVPLALLAAWCIDARHFAVGFCIALLASLVDLIDGTVAELQQRRSPFGNYYETVVDKVVEVILLSGTARMCPLAAFLACATSLLVSFAKARVGLVVITDNRDWPAIGDRADRLLVFLTGLFLAACGYRVAGYHALRVALWAIVALNLLGLQQRMAYARTLIARAEREGSLLPYITRQ